MRWSKFLDVSDFMPRPTPLTALPPHIITTIKMSINVHIKITIIAKVPNLCHSKQGRFGVETATWRRGHIVNRCMSAIETALIMSCVWPACLNSLWNRRHTRSEEGEQQTDTQCHKIVWTCTCSCNVCTDTTE